jgi:hypothetical protein
MQCDVSQGLLMPSRQRQLKWRTHSTLVRQCMAVMDLVAVLKLLRLHLCITAACPAGAATWQVGSCRLLHDASISSAGSTVYVVVHKQQQCSARGSWVCSHKRSRPVLPALLQLNRSQSPTGLLFALY